MTDHDDLDMLAAEFVLGHTGCPGAGRCGRASQSEPDLDEMISCLGAAFVCNG